MEPVVVPGIEVVVVGQAQKIAHQRVQPGGVPVDGQGVVPGTDAVVPMHIGKWVTVSGRVRRQPPLILHYAHPASGHLALLGHILEAKHQPGQREIPVLGAEIRDVRVQLWVAHEIENILLLDHNGDAALGQQSDGVALIVITAGEKTVAQILGRDVFVGGDAARLLLLHHHLAAFSADVDAHVKSVRHDTASFHSFGIG